MTVAANKNAMPKPERWVDTGVQARYGPPDGSSQQDYFAGHVMDHFKSFQDENQGQGNIREFEALRRNLEK